jgi:hypothetical protein
MRHCSAVVKREYWRTMPEVEGLPPSTLNYHVVFVIVPTLRWPRNHKQLLLPTAKPVSGRHTRCSAHCKKLSGRSSASCMTAEPRQESPS